jgi:hypothetical protein
MLVLLLGSMMSVSILAKAQEDKKNPFANGQPIGLVYANFHTGINQGNNPTGFEVTRAYLGYEFQMNNEFSSKIVIDIGSPDDVSEFSLLRRFAYFKNAYLQYKKGKFQARFGIIPLQQFKLQETIWGHRYIEKTVTDAQRMASSADLGASLDFYLNKSIKFDLTLMNGEGYSNLQTDESFKVGFGTTIRPWKGLMLRFYGDAITKGVTQVFVVTFIGYQINDKFNVGFEYDFTNNYRFEDQHNKKVMSTYASWDFNEKFQVFARYDFVTSNIIENESVPWNLDGDGSSVIAGIQYRPISKVKIALDYQDWYPYAANETNLAFIFLNFEFRVW